MLAFSGVVLVLFASRVHAEIGPCPLPDDLTEADKLRCVKGARIFVPQPSLTLEQVVKGPDFDPADPQGSRHLYFEEPDSVLCYFRPHYAFKRIPGGSLKFHCWRLTEDRRFQGRDGAPMAIDQPRIEIRPSGNGEKRARIVDAGGNRQRPDRIKVKYLDPPHPNHRTRYHEVFTEVAVSRFFWLLGIPADRMYSVAHVRCVGCESDPFRFNGRDPFDRGSFRRGQTENEAAATDDPQVFDVVSIGRNHAFDEIESDTEYWRWRDVAEFYGDGTWDNRQKAEYDAYRLALGLVFYHNPKRQQNRVACAREQDSDGQTLCLEPHIFVQDVGSSFGRKETSFLRNNPRGEYRHWKDMTVFRDPSKCELRAPLRGPRQVSKDGLDLLLPRLDALNRATVEAVFRAARFDRMDQRQLERLRNEGVPDPSEAAIREWTDTFMARVEEVRSVRGCEPLPG
jgi:hypothetical protein